MNWSPMYVIFQVKTNKQTTQLCFLTSSLNYSCLYLLLHSLRINMLRQVPHTTALVLWFQSAEDHPPASQPQCCRTTWYFLFWTSVPDTYAKTYPSVVLFLWLLLPSKLPWLGWTPQCHLQWQYDLRNFSFTVLTHSANIYWAPIWW